MRAFLLLALLAPIMAFEVEFHHSPAMDALQAKQSRIMEKEITAILECIRDVLKNGDEATGFPSWNPLDVPELNLNLDNLNLQGISGHFNLKDIHIAGVPNWNLEKLKIQVTIIPIGAKITVKISWPTNDINGSYDANVNIFDHTVVGSGAISGDLSALVFQLEAQATIKPIKIKSAKFTTSLGSSNLKIENLAIDGTEVSAEVEQFVSQLPAYLKDNQKNVQKIINDVILPAINKILAAIGGKTMNAGYEIPIIGHCFPANRV